MNPSFGHCEILAELGRGTTGIVYRARHTVLNRDVAVKMPDLTSEPVSSMRKWQAMMEATTIADLQRENWDIPTLYEVGEEQGQPYLVREFVEGSTLEQAGVARMLDLRGGLGILASIARTVQRLHERGIVHCNLHPANILLPVEASPKLIGFGMLGFVERLTDVPPAMTGAAPKTDVRALQGMLNWLSESLAEALPPMLDELRRPGAAVKAATFAETLSRAAVRPDSSRPWWQFWL